MTSSNDKLSQLARDVRAAAQAARLAAEGAGPGPSPIDLALLRGQLRSKSSHDVPFGVDRVAWGLFVIHGRALCDEALPPEHRVQGAQALIEAARQVEACCQRAGPAAEVNGRSVEPRKDIFG